jgi:biopolymer transport protein ExbD
MGAQLGTKGAFSDINMTPLIDIVLVVLIIMMVNIPIQIEEMGLKLPSNEVTPPPPDTQNEQLVIAIYKPDADGAESKLALNRRIMGEKEMMYEISRRLRPMTNKNVFVDADKSIPYGKVVDMVDLARQAGAANVGLAKMKDDGPLPATSVSAGSGMPRGVLLGSPLVVGAITEVIADASIQPLKGAITQCYFQQLATTPDLTGSYSIKVEVGPEGQLLSPPSIEDDAVGNPALSECVTKLLPALHYAPLKPAGDVTTAGIRYPVLFSPG